MHSILCVVTAVGQRVESGALGRGTGPDLTRYLLVCCGLIAAVVVLGIVFRRLVGRTLRTRAAQRSMQIVDLLPLGGKQRLAVVRCYDRTFLVGLGEKEIESIAELDATVAPAQEPAPLRADLQAFSAVLERFKRPAQRKSSAAKEGILA
jgi:flagellar biogenesis protein FliO